MLKILAPQPIHLYIGQAHVCDARTTLARDNGYTRWFAALSKPSALGHQPKGAGSPVEAVLVEG